MKRTFFSDEHLAKWLSQHPDGERILTEVVDIEKRPATVQMLAVTYGDRIELFAPRYVRIVEVTAITGDGQKAEQLADELVNLQLPLGLRRLFEPFYRRAVLMPRRVTPSQYADRRMVTGLVEVLVEEKTAPAVHARPELPFLGGPDRTTA